MKRKSIVLSDIESASTKKAVLTLEQKDGGLVGSLRLYNFPYEPSGILSLGLYSQRKVFKAGLTRKSQMLYDFYVNLDDIPAKFSCAIVNFQNAQPKPVLYGSSEGSNDDIYANIISEVSDTKSFEKTKEVLDKYGVDFEEDEKKEIEKEIDKNLCQENCENCIYKKYFYENANSEEEKKPLISQVEDFSEQKFDEKENFKAQMFGSKDIFNKPSSQILKTAENSAPAEEKNEKEQLGENANENCQKIMFFDRLKPQIDKLFENNPAENALQSLFPSSKWVKVEYEDEGDFFVFGLLYDEDGNVKYVCYGVPAVFDETPPNELAGYPIWLPLDDQNGFGYWMTYQDAATGEPLKAILD